MRLVKLNDGVERRVHDATFYFLCLVDRTRPGRIEAGLSLMGKFRLNPVDVASIEAAVEFGRRVDEIYELSGEKMSKAMKKFLRVVERDTRGWA